ncbi:hypothetical protein AWENTII_008537 [Aspergillus wentii]
MRSRQSIDLTRLPAESTGGSSAQRDVADTPSFQYSSREMCPPHLLIQQLRRAYSIFLLHHDFTLEEFYQRVGRLTFCGLLERFWERFAWSWEVLLSGNPAVDMYNGIKLSAGGELGIGVGEEEWGSGEREVLEDFVFRTEGLVDLVVSRFGDPATNIEDPNKTEDDELLWLGSDGFPRPSDGVIFSGVGAIERSSLVRVSQWMEWIYRNGDDAYGVSRDPKSPRRQRQRKKRQRGRLSSKDANTSSRPASDSQVPTPDRNFSPGIPRPLVMGTSQPPQIIDGKDSAQTSGESSPAPSERGSDWSGFGTETFMKYLTLGYGSSWSLSSGTPSPHPRVAALKEEGAPSVSQQYTSSTDTKQPNEGDASQTQDTKEDIKPKIHNTGKFIIGLRNDQGKPKDHSTRDNSTVKDPQSSPSDGIVQRTLHVRVVPSDENTTGSKKLQAVVYVHQPFIFTFLFDTETPSLAEPSLYNDIQHQLAPLQKSLSNSTSPANAAQRISMSENTFDSNKRFSIKNQPVYDLVYDPSNLTIRSSIPNIPDPAANAGDPNAPPPWSRVESLNIHHRLLSTYAETRSRPLELERTCKTNRGWWVVWVRLSEPPTTDKDITDDEVPTDMNSPAPQEAFVIRRASDHVPAASHSRNGSGARFLRDLGGASPRLQASRADMGPGKLVEGLGLDARRYIEGLLRLNQ